MLKWCPANNDTLSEREMSESTSANEAMLEIAVNAAGEGHDLGGFVKVDASVVMPQGFEARCRRCERTAWVGEDGLSYSLLGDGCAK
jgi:hypothetical protein